MYVNVCVCVFALFLTAALLSYTAGCTQLLVGLNGCNNFKATARLAQKKLRANNEFFRDIFEVRIEKGREEKCVCMCACIRMCLCACGCVFACARVPVCNVLLCFVVIIFAVPLTTTAFLPPPDWSPIQDYEPRQDAHNIRQAPAHATGCCRRYGAGQLLHPERERECVCV